jgi:Tfp pilus assembly protein PilO
MKLIISINTFIIIILLALVFSDNVNSLDFLRTKNDMLQREYLIKINDVKNIDSLHVEIEKQINFRKSEREKKSKTSYKNNILIGIVMFLTVFNLLIILIKSEKNEQNPN